ncbi:MAG: translation initiation factor IF-2, partial [Candidatus Nealsonbacteria bacterium]|nr:translation initiation factor IF-2 [Candidatus Nealsonbacteria bacterium]
MPVRIYSLAKQLNVDSKILVDVCNKVGITGKGSALASLSDEEADKIRARLSGADKKAATAKVAAEKPVDEGRAITREDYIAPVGTGAGKIRVLEVKAKKPPEAPEPAEETLPAQMPPEIPAAPKPPLTVSKPPLTVPKPPLTVPKMPAAPEPPLAVPEIPAAPEMPTLSQAPIPPTRPPLSAKLGPLGELTSRSKAESKPRPKPPERVGPSIKLAPMPAASPLPVKAKSKEPAPQKPDIKLPPDAIRASKAGTKPLSEHLRKHEKRKAAGKSPSTPSANGPAMPGEPPASTTARSRRGGRTPTAGAGAAAGAGAGAGAKGGDGVTLGGREQRQLKRKRTTTRRRGPDDRFDGRRRRTRIRRTGANTAAPRKGSVVVPLPCTVRDFSEAIGTPVSAILGKLMQLGTMSSITANLDMEMAEYLADDFGVEVDFQQEVTLEDKIEKIVEQADDPDTLRPRPPIITFLGHVDHGKTSLLDRIINIDVVSGEKGGITQHIRAYQIEKDGRAISFVDTPGHEAFTEMRARGANVTDIAVLVVAADDGVMPQTKEAIAHARAADVPIVVALNKIDLPGVDPERSLTDLAHAELQPSEWGGETEVVRTSATTGEGLDDLLETLLTVAELHEYSAKPDRSELGTCLESEMHEGRGVVSKLLVQRGTLRVGDVVVCGAAYGRVKAMTDTLLPRKRHKEAGPSMPVNVTGLNVAPGAGDRFYVIEDISEARQLAERRASASRQRELASARPHVTLETLFDRLGEADEIQTLNVILRADVRGSIEAIQKELTKLEHPEVQIKILQATVGGITEADVHLADASDAVIIGFNVVPDEGARALADAQGVQVRRYDIIYQITTDLKAAVEGMLRPEEQEKQLGRALVQQTFHVSRSGTIAGCRVLGGTIERNSRVRVIRESRVIGDYRMDSLRREKDDVREVREGFECGIKLAGFNDLKEG